MRRLVLGLAVALGCSNGVRHPPGDRPSFEPARRDTTADAALDAPADAPLDAELDAPLDAPLAAADAALAADAEPYDDPMAIHYDTQAGLLALVDVRPLTPAQYRVVRPDLFLSFNVGPAVTRMNQGNKLIAHHSLGRRACLDRLKDVVLQTDEQRARCGAPNMVPVYRRGDPTSAHFCIDVFEFPNKPCELPFVWAAPTHAQTMCALQGKRLCTQQEWSLACRADPAGGPDTTYAYGNDLDLHVCNTDKPRGRDNTCSTRTAKTAWATCGTDTEPSGSFPKCRSHFGVYDMHGNVAEIMTRRDKDGTVVSQLKGSAFFYAEVAQKPNEPGPRGRQTYPDNCNYDPRWHVEPMDRAWHASYHLGFRCCKTIK
jgi:sulfatase modifying factor 1